MDSEFAQIYKKIENTDQSKDLQHRSLHVSADGLSWRTISPAGALGLNKEDFLRLYYYMLLSRHTDDEIARLSKKSMASGKHLMSTGNEASAVGSAYALGDNDWFAPAIRDLGAHLVRGISVYEILCQARGRVDGPTRGWDASLHFGSRDKKIVGLISHLGTMAPVSVGCAFAEKYRGAGNAVLAFSGEGASSTGNVHEALNIAAVLDLPFVLVIENNQWAFGTPSALQFKVPTLALRALGYGRNVEGYWIDGTQVLTVFDTVRKALDKARDKNIITIIETSSMRLEGHSLADPFRKYVPEEQLEVWEKKEPISSYKKLLLDKNLAKEKDLEDIEAKALREVEEASIKAEKCDRPDSKNIESQVFVLSPEYKNPIVGLPAEGDYITYKQAISDAMREEMKNDDDLFIIGEDIGISNGAFHVTKGFLEDFDNLKWRDQWKTGEQFIRRRVVDAPLAEAGFCGLASGAALAGLKVIVEFQFADFSSEAFKMIVNYLATQISRGFGPHHVVFRCPAGCAGYSSFYHSINPESWFGSTPGLKIVAPVTAFDAKGLFRASIRDGNPVLFLEFKNYYNIKPEGLPSELNLPVPKEDYVVPIGKARVVKEGADLTVVTYGSQIFRVLEAVQEIESGDEVSIEVIDLRTIKPYDKECISKSVRKTSKVLVTWEAQEEGAFGHTIVSKIQRYNFSDLDAPVEFVASANTHTPFAKELQEAYLPTREKLVNAIGELLKY